MTVRDRPSVLRSLWTAVRAASRPGSAGVGARLRALPRLVVATTAGRYHGTSRWRLLAILAALLYIVSPIDLVPEGLLGVFGLADDAVVLTWVAVAVVNETEDFLAWEADPQRRPRGRTAGGAGASEPSAGPRPGGSTVRSTVVDHEP